MAEQTADDSFRECPYCGHTYQPESEEYSETARDEQCSKCGKKYRAHDSFGVTHYATPDCELNGESHEWHPEPISGGPTYLFCSKCEKCKPRSSQPDKPLR